MGFGNFAGNKKEETNIKVKQEAGGSASKLQTGLKGYSAATPSAFQAPPPNSEVSMFKFGKANAEVEMSGHCSVAEGIEACEWSVRVKGKTSSAETIPTSDPKFKIVF
eukprot:CAMPEP_0196595978 /NCGR_PEP_ID=MMETSP1081-20130531/83466_1 /TAXON_ID=36882 /ORGANISM="Pyramimonas amylifera, Strain CCMP720" /LENGTH=107 /DNA_ID=CAMNT_0041920781 /DNA_START=107 /DNA_END=430 /DNA_ORIENTATION=+